MFQLTAGTYAWPELAPGDGQVFVGGPGVVLDGQGQRRFAFYGSASNVTLSELEITGFHGDGNWAAIHGWDAHNWVLEDLDVHHNAIKGASPRHGTKVLGGRYHHNGVVGITITETSGVVIDGVELDNNNTSGVNPLNEAGGIKITVSDGVIVRNSFIHDNNGPGIWYDIDAPNGRIESNVVTKNRFAGIFYEISQGCTIRGNEVTGNGFANDYWHGAGILLSDAANCLVERNSLSGNRRGVIVLDEGRRSHGSQSNTIRDNDIDMSTGTTGFATKVSAGTVFELNRYVLHGRSQPMQLPGRTVSWTEWRNSGEDSGSTIR